MIEKTLNYNMFKKHESNRQLIERNIEEIMESIQQENLLHVKPILVDGEMRVIDGQHRLEAAKRLNLPIYYQVEEKIKVDSIYLLNNNQRKWGLNDYIEYHASLGGQEYLKLKRFMKKNNTSMPICLALLGVNKGGSGRKTIVRGTFKFPNEFEECEILIKLQNLRKVVEYLQNKLLGMKEYIAGATFAHSFVFFLNCKNVDFETFMKKLPYRMDSIRPCARQQQYLDLFRDIYNYKNQSPITLEKVSE